MKAKLFCILAVLALATVSFAQKTHDVGASISVPASVTVGTEVNIDLFVWNLGSKSVTIREIELYCGIGTTDPPIWEEIVTRKRVTINAGDVWHVGVTYTPTCAGPWSLQAWMCFGGSGKTDLMTPLTTFTVTE